MGLALRRDLAVEITSREIGDSDRGFAQRQDRRWDPCRKLPGPESLSPVSLLRQESEDHSAQSSGIALDHPGPCRLGDIAICSAWLDSNAKAGKGTVPFLIASGFWLQLVGDFLRQLLRRRDRAGCPDSRSRGPPGDHGTATGKEIQRKPPNINRIPNARKRGETR